MTHTPQNIFEQRAYYVKHFLCAWFLLSLVSVFWFSAPATAGAEYIDSFKAKIEVSKDSSFIVTEEITYVFTGEKHGIFRFIPILHHDQPQSFSRERYIDIDIEEVRMDNESVPYEIADGRNEISIKIGDPQETIDGIHRYTIRYKVSGALAYEENGGAELYWNVTGDKWEVPIYSAVATVMSSDGILIRERACYQGIEGETSSCEVKNVDDGKIMFTASNLPPGAGLTVAQAVNRSVVALDIRERVSVFWMLLLIFGIGLPLLAFFIYQYKTAYKTDKPIIPQYEPYPGVKPMYAGYLFDKRLDPRDITAGIVYLAEQGFIKIHKTEKKVLFFFEVDDYEMTLLRPAEDTVSAFDVEILTLVFGEHAVVGKMVSLSGLKSDYQGSVERTRRIFALRTACTASMRSDGFLTGSFILERRTRKGYEALDYLKGFKDFLSVTESQRYIFHNAPAINAEHFMEYLPYAIAFGVEKEWAKTFEKITIPTPDWYDGGNVGTFNAVALTQSLGGFSTAFAASSGARASSGGGHSGGGSGGGGGGSW